MPRIASLKHLREPWIPVTLSLAALWSLAAVRYSRWAARGDEKAEQWVASHGKPQGAAAALKAWLLENGILVTLTAACMRAFPPRSKERLGATVARHLLRSLFGTEACMVILHLCANHVYPGVPYFSDERKPHFSWRQFLQSWVRLQIPIKVMGAVGDAQELHAKSGAQFDLAVRGTGSGGLLGFLVSFAVVRSLHDLAFYAGHFLIHRPLLYGWIHKRHHEHKEPRAGTNTHFWILDLLVEGGVSLGAAQAGVEIFRRAGFRLSNFQVQYMVCALVWYQIASHAGKQLPCATVFPPLSFIPWIDRTLGGGVAHHHQHHRHMDCNYSIAAWPDRAFGTWKPLRGHAEAEGARHGSAD